MVVQNYNKAFNEIVSGLKGRPTLLMHVCCAPCLAGCLHRLDGIFDITLYYYNPNIKPIEEYNKRLRELRKYIERSGRNYKIIVGEYDEQLYTETVSDYPQQEGGVRCEKCCNMRVQRAAKKADELGYDYYGTTLTASPLKNSKKINEFMQSLVAVKALPLYSDFKKEAGGLVSKRECDTYGVYRQNYCGCTPRQLKVYITGGIASGKSVLLGIMGELGAYTISADKVSRDLYETNEELLSELAEQFPDAFTCGKLDRAKLKAEVFNNTDSLAKLDEITHLAIRKEIAERVSKSGNKICVVEVPLLYEVGWANDADIVMAVSASSLVRKDRAKSRDNMDDDMFDSIVSHQMADGVREELADIVVHNDGDVVKIQQLAKELYSKWQKLVQAD